MPIYYVSQWVAQAVFELDSPPASASQCGCDYRHPSYYAYYPHGLEIKSQRGSAPFLRHIAREWQNRKMTRNPLPRRFISTLFNVYYFTNSDCVQQSWDSLRSEGNQNSGNGSSFMLSIIAQIGDYLCLNMKWLSTAGISTMVFVGPKAPPFVYIIEGGAIHFDTWLSGPYLMPRAAFHPQLPNFLLVILQPFLRCLLSLQLFILFNVLLSVWQRMEGGKDGK